MILTALLVSTLLAQPPAAREPRPPQTDQTVAVTRGARLIIGNFAGEVVVKAWDRDQLRVQARHQARARVNIRPTATAVNVQADSNGPPASVDYEIMAPAWMSVKVEGTYNFITVEGMQGEVSAQTTRGDVVIKGGTGSVVARSIQGEVLVEGGRGKITASSVNEGIRIIGASGDINAETTNGSISLTKITSGSVEAATVNGDIVFEGPMADKGRYQFSTHNGDITAVVPENSNATFTVRTYTGDFSSNLVLAGPPRSEPRRGRLVTYTLGNGSAEMAMETFGGGIRIRKPGLPAGKDKEKSDARKEEEKKDR